MLLPQAASVKATTAVSVAIVLFTDGRLNGFTATRSRRQTGMWPEEFPDTPGKAGFFLELGTKRPPYTGNRPLTRRLGERHESAHFVLMRTKPGAD